LLDQFRDGVWLVELAPQPDAALVVPAIARTLGLKESANQPLATTLVAFLRDKQMLLVPDNFEHVVAAAPEVAALLETASGVKLLVTSRTPLGVYGEHIFPVQPLRLPDLTPLPPPDALVDNAAVALFLQRARAAHAGFHPTALDLAAIAEVCVRLDGLPLAIELAAARVRVLPPAALLARISRRLELLTGGAHNRPVRQQTLRSAIDWSYQLLAEPEQRLFRWLGAFAGDFSLDAAEGVCHALAASAAAEPIGVLERLAALVDHSLLEQRGGPDAALPRFGMLETIHDFAVERLEESGEAGLVRAAHARVFLTLAEDVGHEVADGREPQAALARLDAEHDNLRAALAWTLDDQREADVREVGSRLASALWRFWAMRGYLTEGQQWVDRALRADGDVAPVWRARALNASGNLARWHGEFALATERHEACLALRRELGDKPGEATSLLNLGNIAFDVGDFPRAVELFGSSLTLYREVADEAGAALALNNLGTALREAGQPEQAVALHEESLALRRALGDRLGIAQALDNLGRVAMHRGDWQRAGPLLRESLVLWRELGDRLSAPRTIEDLASLAAAEGDAERAVRLWGAADALRTRLGFPIALRRRQRYTAELEDARSRLGEARFATAWATGQVLDPDAAIADALSEHVATPPKVPEGVEQLSAREREVAALIARGLTSREIAAELIVSERTVDTHADHIRTKLGLRSRTDIAAWAAARGLRS
jgi:predicted ATPase/DNA-binding CsgD family transcriptional regulator